MWILLILWHTLITLSLEERSPILKLLQGELRGTLIRSTQDGVISSVEEFLGVPFGEPPLGNLRFRPPLPIKSWASRGIRNATQLAPSCMQIRFETFQPCECEEQWNAVTNAMSEDCLYMNIWRPVPQSPNELFPVMIWIYGGCFLQGSANLDIYNGSYLAAEQRVIVVTINYRVASFGFLYFGNDDVIGNAGLRDQELAMRFIKDNLQALRGQKGQVTVFGESAGAASIAFHLASNSSLFDRAILQSGVSSLAWAFVTIPEAQKRASKLALKNNCPSPEINPVEAAACLRRIPAVQLKDNDWVTSGLFQFPWTPVVDGHYIDRHPSLQIRDGWMKKCPIMLGVNKNEANYFILYEFSNWYTRTSREMEKLFSNVTFFKEVLIQLFQYYPRHDYNISASLLENILIQYTPWQNPTNGKLAMEALDNALGDYHIKCEVLRWSDRLVELGFPVYFYQFVHRSSRSLWPQWTGSLHGDEIHYVFNIPARRNSGYHEAEKLLAKSMGKAWANFARTGSNPLSNWKPYELYDRRFFSFDASSDQLYNWMMTGGMRVHECAFWLYAADNLQNSRDSAVSPPLFVAWKNITATSSVLLHHPLVVYALLATTVVLLLALVGVGAMWWNGRCQGRLYGDADSSTKSVVFHIERRNNGHQNNSHSMKPFLEPESV